MSKECCNPDCPICRDNRGYHIQSFKDNQYFGELTIEEIVQRVIGWQNFPYTHPLTCEKDSTHDVLIPGFKRYNVILYCPTCGYVQDWIPGVVLSTIWYVKS